MEYCEHGVPFSEPCDSCDDLLGTYIERARTAQARHDQRPGTQLSLEMPIARLQEKSVEDYPISVMLYVSGNRLSCYQCGASVFTKTAPDKFACNGCSTEYEGVK